MPIATNPQLHWVSKDPKSKEWVFYSPDVDQQIEAAHGQGLAVASVTIDGIDFSVDFGKMRQCNQRGGSRRVKRVNVVAPWHSGGRMHSGPRSHVSMP